MSSVKERKYVNNPSKSTAKTKNNPDFNLQNKFTDQELLRDYNYKLLGKSTWVDVRNMTVNVVKDTSGLLVEIYPLIDDGIADPLARMYVRYDEAQVEVDKALKSLETANQIMRSN